MNLILLCSNIEAQCVTHEESCVQFSWDASTESDLAGYRFYERWMNGVWTQIATLPKNETVFDCASIEGWPKYGQTEFAVTAFDLSGNESVRSETVCADISPMPELLADVQAPAVPLISDVQYFASGAWPEEFNEGVDRGVTVYVDRSYTVTDLPEALRGSAYISFPNDAKTHPANPLASFSLSRQAEVCIARDVRLPNVPTWMTGYLWNGLDMLVTTDARMRLYCQGQAGVVEVGSNEGVGASSMYVVIVRG